MKLSESSHWVPVEDPFFYEDDVCSGAAQMSNIRGVGLL